MFVPLSSLERLRDDKALASFQRLFKEHGALGYGVPASPGTLPLTESERLALVPLVFGLLPAQALKRKHFDEKVKPYIRDHLLAVGVTFDDELLSILKSVADQYSATWSVNIDQWNIRRKSKLKIAALRARGLPYRRQLKKQNSRCGVCGALFDGSREEHLDHIIPWRLIGDIPDGSNWQILCSECNMGKGSLIASLLSPEAWSWVYSVQSKIFDEQPTLQTRYVVLSQRAHCEIPGCGNTNRESEWSVSKILQTGLAVADNLRVVCESHL